MPTRKLWNHTINIKEGFVLRKGKIYPLSTASMFFVGKKNEKSVQYRTIGILMNGLLRIVTLYFLFQTSQKTQTWKEYLQRWT